MRSTATELLKVWAYSNAHLYVHFVFRPVPKLPPYKAMHREPDIVQRQPSSNSAWRLSSSVSSVQFNFIVKASGLSQDWVICNTTRKQSEMKRTSEDLHKCCWSVPAGDPDPAFVPTQRTHVIHALHVKDGAIPALCQRPWKNAKSTLVRCLPRHTCISPNTRVAFESFQKLFISRAQSVVSVEKRTQSSPYLDLMESMYSVEGQGWLWMPVKDKMDRK